MSKFTQPVQSTKERLNSDDISQKSVAVGGLEGLGSLVARCHPCLRYELLPMCPVWTKKKLGEGGIRTHGTLLEYGHLANACFQPLSHLSIDAIADFRRIVLSRAIPFFVNRAMAKNGFYDGDSAAIIADDGPLCPPRNPS